MGLALKSLSLPPRWRTAILIAAAVVLAVFLLRAWGKQTTSAAAIWTPDYCHSNALAHNGRALIHGVPLEEGSITWSMPGYVVGNAIVCDSAGGSTRLVIVGFILLGCALLVFGIGRIVASTRCGLLAVAILLFAFSASEFDDRWLYVFAVLLVAYAVVWRAQRPSVRRSAVVGATVGMSLYILSPLFFFPGVLLTWETFRSYRRGTLRARVFLAEAGVLCLIPLLLLLPWVWMNWRWSGRFVLLEDGRANLHLVTSVLGFVHTVPRGDAFSLAGLDADQSVVWWALREVFTHPGRFLSACVQRVGYVLALQPKLAALGGIGLVWSLIRGWRGASALGLLIVYWFVLHSLLSTERRYFIPFWPLLIVPAAGLIECRARERLRRAPARLMAILLAVTAVPLLGFHLYVSGLVVAYPARARAPEALDRAVLCAPTNAWLLQERGADRLQQGDVEGAVADLSHAYELRAGESDRRLQLKLAWALVVGGRPIEEVTPLLPTTGYGAASEQHLTRAFYRLARGEWQATQDHFARARTVHEDEVLDVPLLADPELRKHLVVSDNDLRAMTASAIGYWPVARRVPLLHGLRAILRSDPEFFLNCDWLACQGLLAINAALETEQPEVAFETFAAVDCDEACGRPELRPHVSGVATLAKLLQDRGETGKALKLWEWLAHAHPENPSWREAFDALRDSAGDTGAPSTTEP